MVATVNWTPYYHSVNVLKEMDVAPELLVLCQEPDNLYKHILTIREKSHYLKCYALMDILKNAFIVRAPLDLKLSFDRENNWLSVEGIDQKFYDGFVVNRVGTYGENDPPLVSLFPRYIFYSDTPVQLMSLPLPIIGEPENTRLIVGGFDISKWIRPVEWAFEFVDEKKEVVLKRGDPLFMLMFTTPDNELVKLNRVPFDPELMQISGACARVKTKIRNVPLKKCYEMAESFVSAWRKYRRR